VGGRAIENTKTTAPHALSYELTSAFGVPHGHAVALTLGVTLEYNAAVTSNDCSDARGPLYVIDTIDAIVGTLGATSPSDANRLLGDLMADLGLETSLMEVGAGSAASRARIVGSVNMARLSGNPRTFDEEALGRLVDSIA
jgi:alcohol dehydrogenase class IV